MIEEFKQGWVVGLSCAIPVGPIALLIMRRSAQDGRLAGIVSGLGAATADLMCGLISALGMTVLTRFFEHHVLIIRLVGGVFLIGMGVHTLRAKISLETPRPIHERNLWLAYGSTAFLTLVNPLTLGGMLLISAAAGVGAGELSPLNTSVFILSVFLASAVWWLMLSFASHWLGRKLGTKLLSMVNHIAGVVLILVGIVQLAQLIRSHF